MNAGYAVDELQRGMVDYYAGEYGVALGAIDRYLANSPADPAAAYYYRGLILRATDEYYLALEQWNLVMQGYPESPLWDEAWEQKAYTQWAYLDDYDGARQTLLDFVAAAPVHSRAGEFLFDAAQVAERANNLDEAAVLWRRLGFDYVTTEWAPRGFYLAGITDYRRGDFPTALDDFNRALANATAVEDKAAAMLWIGKTQQALGDPAAAQAVWQQAADLDPTGYYSERARELKAGKAPFETPANFDLGRDLAAERAEAEAWMRSTFGLAAEVDLSSPGELLNDPKIPKGRGVLAAGLVRPGKRRVRGLAHGGADGPDQYLPAGELPGGEGLFPPGDPGGTAGAGPSRAGRRSHADGTFTIQPHPLWHLLRRPGASGGAGERLSPASGMEPDAPGELLRAQRTLFGRGARADADHACHRRRDRDAHGLASRLQRGGPGPPAGEHQPGLELPVPAAGLPGR